jgi:nitronate monooxygenase
MVGEGVETGWRAPLAGEGTVRLSSKGESDLQPERDRLCHSGRLRSFRAPTGRLLTTRYAISSSNSIQRSSVFILAFRNKKLVQRVLNTGAKIVSSATSVDEARWLEDRGIADARGVVAAFALGAAAVQIGTAYLLSRSQSSPAHREALKNTTDAQTTLTNIFTGRPARAIMNRAIKELGPISENVPDFPLAATALGPLRSKAEAAGSGDFTPLWSGQAARLAGWFGAKLPSPQSNSTCLSVRVRTGEPCSS